ncbi:Uncharacterised protein [Vibrio cholerae]|nr:Uncharacterised protein [Vibrio cholerae]CSA47091.1 Uncharacterised protein [Vibrio cholerae]CSB29777.1 Uncharacterised protein [Vibrio cholerae]CSB42835.1 Uncharacterised protein [Vibrio cholerae]CSB49025.1 Uncharacterised protein [Vibrio cholerae]
MSELSAAFATLINQDFFRFPAAIHNGFIDHGLVGNHLIDFHAARGGHDHFRLRIFNPYRQLIRCKAAKHHRVNRAQTRTSQHRHRRFWDHRHVNDDTITFAHPLRSQHACNFRDTVTQCRVTVALLFARHGRVVNQRSVIATALLAVIIEC